MKTSQSSKPPQAQIHDSQAPPLLICLGQQRAGRENYKYTPVSELFIKLSQKTGFLFIKKDKRNNSYTSQYHQGITTVLELEANPPGQTSNPGSLLTWLTVFWRAPGGQLTSPSDTSASGVIQKLIPWWNYSTDQTSQLPLVPTLHTPKLPWNWYKQNGV